MPRRRKIIISHGEAFCGKVLKEKGLKTIPQYRIKLLPRYRFDYYFTYQGREYLLEFDGQQHFRFTPWFHRSEKDFEKRRKRDLVKTSIALNSGYHVIRIAYCDLPRTLDVLEEALESQDKLTLSNIKTYTYFIEHDTLFPWSEKYIL